MNFFLLPQIFFGMEKLLVYITHDFSIKMFHK